MILVPLLKLIKNAEVRLNLLKSALKSSLTSLNVYYTTATPTTVWSCFSIKSIIWFNHCVFGDLLKVI
jgi:hypothetical protein